MGTTTTTVNGITFTITQGTAGDLLYSTENFPGASGPGTTGYCGGTFTTDALYTSITERKSLIAGYDQAALQAESDLIKVLSFPKQELGPDYTQAQYNYYVKELQDKRDINKQRSADAQFLSNVQQALIDQVSGVTASFKASNPDSNATPSPTGAEPSPVANEDKGTPNVSNSQPALTSDPNATSTATSGAPTQVRPLSDSLYFVGVDEVNPTRYRYFDVGQNKYITTTAAPTQEILDSTNRNLTFSGKDPVGGAYIYLDNNTGQRIFSSSMIPTDTAGVQPLYDGKSSPPVDDSKYDNNTANELGPTVDIPTPGEATPSPNADTQIGRAHV